MADPQDGPENNAGATQPAPAKNTARKAPAKKSAAKKAPAKSVAAKKAVARKAAAKKAPAKKAAAGAVAKKAPARKAPAKKATAKKAPAKKAPAKKMTATAKKTPPTPALEPGHQSPALEAAPTHAALTSGANTARDTPAPVKTPARDAGKPVPAARAQDGGRPRLPLSIGLAALGLVAMVLNRFRRG